MRNTDVTVENFQAISDLCKQGNLPDNAEDVVILIMNLPRLKTYKVQLISLPKTAGVKSRKKWTTTAAATKGSLKYALLEKHYLL
jgi:hypothetical protein